MDGKKFKKHLKKIAAKDVSYKKESIFINDIKEVSSLLALGKYQDVRDELERLNSQKHTLYMEYMYNTSKGDLEMFESNFSAASKCYRKSYKTEKNLFKTCMKLSNAKQSEGDFSTAKKYLDKLLNNKTIRDVAMIEFACMLIVQKDYVQAYDVVKKINVNNLSYNDKNNYKYLIQFLSYELTGNLSNVPEIKDVPNYKFDMYLSNSIYRVGGHVEKHFSSGKKNEDCKFYSDTNFRYLYDMFFDSMYDKRPIRNCTIDLYNVVADDYIGMVNNVHTKDFTVYTNVNSDKILTMFPILTSIEFDRNKESVRKR